MTKVAESKTIVGLEIGTHKVVAVVGEVLPDGVIRVLGSGISPSKGVQSGGVVDLDAVSSAISRAIEEAESISECRIIGVTLAISGPHIQAINESGIVRLTDNVKDIDLENAINLAKSVKLDEGLEILHILPQEFRVDRLPATKNPTGLAGMRLEAQVHLIACHKDWLLNLKNAVERSKLKIDQIVFSGLASSYSVLTDDEKELGVCLIDIGGGTMDILVYTDGALRFSKVLPFGGNNITDFVAQNFATTRPEAENIKIHYGSAISPPLNAPEKKINVVGLGGTVPRTFTKAQLSQFTARCYYELFNIVATELQELRNELYQKGIKQELIAGIVLTGGGSQIEDIVECAKSVFNLQVRVGYPLNITGLSDYVNKPQYATALGLLQYSHYNDMDSRSSDIPNKVSGIIGVVVENVKNYLKSKF